MYFRLIRLSAEMYLIWLFDDSRFPFVIGDVYFGKYT